MDYQSFEGATQVPIIVGILTDDSLRADAVLPIIEGLGWSALRLDASRATQGVGDEIDLVVLTLTRVGESGLELIASVGIRSRAKILVISDDRNPQVIADALRSGADDYLVSPFATAELVVRMRALVTRVWPSTDRRLGKGFRFDNESRTVEVGPYAVQFTPLEWDVLTLLLESDGLPVSVETIVADTQLQRIQATTVPTIISRIRRKLEAENLYAITILTVQNRGYVAQFRRSSDQFESVAGGLRFQSNDSRSDKQPGNSTDRLVLDSAS